MKPTFLASIKERFCLNPDSDRKTYHIVLDLEGSGIEYRVGDCLGIYPENSLVFVERFLEQFGATGDEEVQNREGQTLTSREFLVKYANLSRLPKEPCDTIQTFCKKLPPMLPRFYSIASSMDAVGNEAHLTVALEGVCTNYLCNQVPLNKPLIPVFHKSSPHFTLPEESSNKPIIMIGPGTGIAPFRGFMQARVAQSASSKNWLFFGERYRSKDFYYQKDWESFSIQGQLQFDCAFSRDQQEKIYVQHLMLKKKTQLWQWLQDGAYLYVCGDASKMAKDVDQTLVQIAQTEGKLPLTEAKLYIKNLRKAKRYQRDVY